MDATILLEVLKNAALWNVLFPITNQKDITSSKINVKNALY